jgi:Starch binding domain
VRVSVSYPTRWGQTVKLVGDGAVLGKWQPSCGVPLTCQHVDDKLVWSASLALPKTPELTYKYVVVNEGGAVEDAETRPRTVRWSDGLSHGATVVLYDEWQVQAVRRVLYVPRLVLLPAMHGCLVAPSRRRCVTLYHSHSHQDKSDPGNVLATSAFQKVIFSGRPHTGPDAQPPQQLAPSKGQTVLRLRVWWVWSWSNAMHACAELQHDNTVP